MNLSFLVDFFLSFVIVVGLIAERLHSMLVFLLMFLTGSLIDNFFSSQCLASLFWQNIVAHFCEFVDIEHIISLKLLSM